MKGDMQNIIKSLISRVNKLTTITPASINNIPIKVASKSVPLCDISSVTIINKALHVKVAEKDYIKPIENAIRAANLGLNPVLRENTLVLNIPKPSADQRKNLEKQIKQLAELSKGDIRQMRAKEMKKIKEKNKDLEKQMKDDVQKVTDEHVEQVDSFVKKVLKELQ